MALPTDALHAIVHDDVRRFLADLAGPADDPLVAAMEERAAATDFPIVGRTTGRWLELLVRMIGGKRVFEIGSGYGYSAFFFARAVGEGGVVIGSDDNPALLELHQQMWRGHPLRSRVDIRLGRGAEVLAGVEGSFDAFLIDSTKSEYTSDLESAVARLRPGGLVLVDNVLWGGRVTREATDDTTRAIQEFDRRLFADPRFDVAILPSGDGLGVARKR